MTDLRAIAEAWLKKDGPWKGTQPPHGGAMWNEAVDIFLAGASWQRDRTLDVVQGLYEGWTKSGPPQAAIALSVVIEYLMKQTFDDSPEKKETT